MPGRKRSPGRHHRQLLTTEDVAPMLVGESGRAEILTPACKLRELTLGTSDGGLEQVGRARHVEVGSHEEEAAALLRQQGQHLPRILQRVQRPLLEHNPSLRRASPHICVCSKGCRGKMSPPT